MSVGLEGMCKAKTREYIGKNQDQMENGILELLTVNLNVSNPRDKKTKGDLKKKRHFGQNEES